MSVPKIHAEIAVKMYQLKRNSRGVVAVTSASQKAGVLANMLF